jgi:hypothetical protein
MESELQCRIPCSRSACGGGAQLRRPQGIELTNRRLPAMSEASSKETSGVTKAVRSRWVSTGGSWEVLPSNGPGQFLFPRHRIAIGRIWPFPEARSSTSPRLLPDPVEKGVLMLFLWPARGRLGCVGYGNSVGRPGGCRPVGQRGKCLPGTSEPAHHRSNRHLQVGRGFAVAQILDADESENFTLVLGKGGYPTADMLQFEPALRNASAVLSGCLGSDARTVSDPLRPFASHLVNP